VDRYARGVGSTTKLVPWLSAGTLFMESLDTTILTIAIPVIATALGVAPLEMKSVLSYYTLSLALFIPISGWCAERFGARRVLLAAIALFTVSALACGLARGVTTLAACRLLQGAGGALMVPVARILLVRTFPRSKLVAILSLVSIGAIVGPMVGPLTGALIIEAFDWRMIFLVHVPIGAAGLYLVARYLPDVRVAAAPRLDMMGFVLFGTSLALLSYVLEGIDEHRFSPIGNALLIAVSILLFAGYRRHAARIRHPILRLELLRIRSLRITVVGMFCTRIAFGGLPFLIVLLYQVGFGYSPITSGLLTLPQPIAAVLCKMWIPKILARYGHRTTFVAVTLLAAAVIFAFATVERSTPLWIPLALAACVGFCASLMATGLATLAYADVAETDTNMVATIVSTLQQLSISFGVVTAALIATLSIGDRAHASNDAVVSGLHHGLLGLGIFTLISTLTFTRLDPTDGLAVSGYHGRR